MVTAMSVGAVVCIAVCMSGDIAQDLKTGYLLGATPKKMQLTEFIGLLFPAAAMGFTLYILGDTFGFVESPEHPNPVLAPQANVMATVVQGVMNANIPWTPILVGGFIAAAVELLGIQSLPFAIGLYLPLSLSTPIMLGGLVALIIKKTTRNKIIEKARQQMGILFASGIVAGDALVGVMTAFTIYGSDKFGSGTYREFFEHHEGMMETITGSAGPWISTVAIFGLAVVIYFVAKGSAKDNG